MSDTSHFTRLTEIQNSLGLAKPAADRAVPCRKSDISQQQNGGGAVSIQIGHAPVRLEAQGHTAAQCTKNEISHQQKSSSRAVLTQIGHEPGRLKPGARQQFSAGKTRICSSRTVAGQFQLKSGMHPFGWKPRARQQFSAGRATLRSSRAVAGQCRIRSGMHPFGWKPRARQQFQCRPSGSSQQQNNSSQKTTLQTRPREIGGSAQGLLSGGLRGGGLYGLPGAEKTSLWHKGKALGKTDLEQPEREHILYRLAEISTSMMRGNRGRVGDVARSLGGIL